jgi:hypothetical protein
MAKDLPELHALPTSLFLHVIKHLLAMGMGTDAMGMGKDYTKHPSIQGI